MSSVKQYYDETVELLSFLKGGGNRDKRIEYISSSIERRQELVEQMKPPYTEYEMELGKKSIVLEKELQALLQAEKQLIQKDITSFAKHKQSRDKYINPYKSLNFDGMFYDKRK